ncbi:MAG: SIMPL domain-containing protein [Halolamina sp.]
MNRTVLAVALAGVFLLAGCAAPIDTAAAATDEPTEDEATTVVTNGSGSVTADADLAVVRVAVVAVAETADDAREDAADRSTALVDALEDAGVDANAITTAGYSLNAQYDEAREPTSYRAVHSYRVEVDPDDAGTVVDTSVTEADAEIWGVQFTLAPETRADLRAAAVDAAVQDARLDADAVAAAAGLEVTAVEGIQTDS